MEVKTKSLRISPVFKKKTFARRYKILEKIGEGGMGVVYKAEDTKLKRTVALKFLPLELTKDAQAKARFVQEAQAAAALDHPNICAVFEIGEAEGSTFIAMPYVKGQSLKGRIAQGPLSVEEALAIAGQVAEGLKEAHERGIIHRDIKPANIMLTEKGQARIMDFGLAKLETGLDLTRTMAVIGTAAYMSPEQARGEEVDHRTDIWSFGATLYEMLTGHTFFGSKQGKAELCSVLPDLPAMLHSILYDPIEPPGLLRKDLPRPVEQIILKALDKDRLCRYQSMEAVLRDLKAARSTVMILPKAEKSIIILPFKNISPDADQEYFCDGMTEEIIADLSKIHSLRVISRTSAMMLKGTRKDVQTIARDLNVQYALEGSVRKAGNNLRITAQLIDGLNDAHLWAEKYSGTLGDVFEIQEKVSRSIVDSLKLRLGTEEQSKIKKPTDNIEAYQLYLKGRFFISQLTAEGLTGAIDYFNGAIRRDPSFALAYASIAESYVVLCMGAGILPPKAAMREAKEAALKAVEFGPDLAETYASLGMIETFYGWDRNVAGESFRIALKLNPNAADTLMWCAAYLIVLEHKYEEAFAMLARALELNPLQTFIYSILSWACLYTGQFDKLIDEIKKLQSLDPHYWYSYHMLGEVYLGKGWYQDSIANYEEAVRRGGRSITNIAELGFTQALAGKTNEAMELLRETQKAASRSEMFYGYVGLIYIGLGQYESAFEWLEKASEVHDIIFLFLPSLQWPGLDDFRRDPRFVTLLEKLGLIHLAPQG